MRSVLAYASPATRRSVISAGAASAHECHPDVVLLVTSILSAESVVRSLPPHRLRGDTLFAEVLSVKEFPNRLL
jgi:hypothetical protein